jgi:putative transposase
MKYDPQKHHRRSIRLANNDYSQAGAYFVTLVTHGRINLFGQIDHGEMRLTHCGEIVNQAWLDLPRHYPHIILDSFVIMPNHVHGILMFRPTQDASNPEIGDGAPQTGILAASQPRHQPPVRHGLPEIVRAL